MPDPAQEYRKLPGIGRDVATYSRLYLGPGHLLVVNSTGFTESYKRFYFQDIQAIVLCRTRSRLIWNIILSVPLLLCMSVVIMGIADISGRSAQSDDLFGFVIWGAPASVFAVYMAVNTLLGPTCVCHIRTAVQTERLAPLSRLRRARQVMDRLKPLIAQVQGRLASDDILPQMRDIAGGHGPYDPLLPPVISSSPGSPILPS